MSVTDNKDAARFELTEQGLLVFANYKRSGNEVALLHVEAPEALRGTGAAGRLMQGIVDLTQAEGTTIVPICPYAVHWLNRHKPQ